jgi:hypothetical protein
MGDYLRIARAYLSGTAAAVWCFMFLCLLTFSAVEGELARHQGGIPGGVSRKSYMAMFAYFTACLLGVLLRDNIAHPWASVLPYYRKKHLLVATLIALFFLGIPMLSMEFVGTSDIAPTSVAVIFLTCLAAGLWTLHNPVLGGVLAIPFLVFAMAPSSSSPELAAFLAGTNPAASAALAFISLLALWALAWRLLALNEDMIEYAIARMWGDFLRGRGQIFRGQAKTITEYLAAVPADKRATLQNFDPQKNPFTNLKQVDNLSGYSERSLWQHLQLWRLGTAPTRTSASLGMQIFILLIIIPPFVFIPPLVGAELPARNTVVIFSVMVMTNPFNIWLFWILRLHRLGHESLRPRTRQEFVRELGLALLWDIIQCWLGGVLFMGITAAIWAPELLQVKNILLFILGTGVGQLCAYAMYAIIGIWRLKRGMVASVSCAFCPFLAIAIWMLFIVRPIGVELNIAIAMVLAAASVATIALAYRRWCRADLD